EPDLRNLQIKVLGISDPNPKSKILQMGFLERFSLKEKVVILTGGAGLYGRGLTTRLAEAGANLVIASRNLEKLEPVAEEERARGNRVTAEALDLSSQQSIQDLVARVHRRFGR